MPHLTSSRPPLRIATIVWLLGLSQIVGYGTLYYSFSIIAADIGRSLGWPVAWLYGSFSLALLASGFAAPFVGRRIDRHGSRLIMTAGSVLTTLMLVATSLAGNGIIFTVTLVASQLAAGLVLYEAAFAALVQAAGHDARQRITHLTLIAGMASTIFWPLTSWLHHHLDWRQICLLFAALNLLVCVPIHASLPRRRQVADSATTPPSPDSAPRTGPPLPARMHRQILWLVAIGFALSAFVQSALLATMVPLLGALGLGASALLVSMLFGPAQVLVRFATLMLGRHQHPLRATLLAMALAPLALVVLVASAPLTLGAIVFALLFGFNSGLKSIVQGTLPLALFGAGGYGARLGVLASVRQVLGAIAPFSFAAVGEHAGMPVALWALTGVALLACFVFLLVARLQGRNAAAGA